MNNPLKFKLLEKVHRSDDCEMQVLKLKHRDFNQVVHAKAYTIKDPDDEGAGKLRAVQLQAKTCMIVQAHDQAATCYGYFERRVPKTEEKPAVHKISILMESFQETLLTNWQERMQEDNYFAVKEMWDFFAIICNPLFKFQKEFIYHGSISMGNIIYNVKEENLWKLTDWRESKKTMLQQYPIEKMNFVSDEMLKYLSPETREDIINNMDFEGDAWLSDVYSLGLVCLEMMLLEDLDFLFDLEYSKIERQEEVLEAVQRLKEWKRYPDYMMETLESMLEMDPKRRPNFETLTQKYNIAEMATDKAAIHNRYNRQIEEITDTNNKVILSYEELVEGLFDIIVHADVDNISKLAFESITMSADKENPLGLCFLGRCYQKGWGTDQDYAHAFQVMLEASESQKAIPLSFLANCYDKGIGCSIDHVEAINQLEEAVELNLTSAKTQLGILVQHGKGVTQDYNKAFQLFQEAAECGDSVAHCQLGRLYYKGLGIELDLFKSFHHFLSSANMGNESAYNLVGLCYLYGKGVDKDQFKAIRMFEKGIFLRSGEAINNLGLCYDRGQGVAKDYDLAYVYYQLSAKQGNVTAQQNVKIMGKLRLLKASVKKKKEKAKKKLRGMVRMTQMLGGGGKGKDSKAGGILSLFGKKTDKQ